MGYARWCIAGVAMLLAGCFQVETVVRVDPDGSGTVEERVLVSRKLLVQFETMMQGMAASGGAAPAPLELYDPARLKAQAAEKGDGVTYLSGEKLMTASHTGYRAVYAFTDIGRLRLGQQGGDGAGGAKTPALPVTFRFEKGTPARLTIDLPKGTPAASGAPPPAGAVTSTTEPLPAAEAQRLAESLLGMRYLLAVEVNGTIVETNASHRDGRRLTLVDFDLGRFGTAIPRLEMLGSLNGRSLTEAGEFLKDYPGLTMDRHDLVTVRFGR